MGNFTFGMYSGYLPVDGTKNKLHYILAESQNDPATDPLVIWFNGGPGCSSMLGFLQEHGPYVMEDETNYFHYNNYSWNLEANMLYIEMPAGVGYSYCGESKCTFNDNTTGVQNLNAILNFFKLFPEYQQHDLFVSGESYAGVYVPYVVALMDEYNQNVTESGKEEFQFNLKGFMVGNGVTNWKYDGDTNYLKIGYWFNLYSQSIENQMKYYGCNYYDIDIMPLDKLDANRTQCMQLRRQFSNLTSYINVYDLYRRCLDPGVANDTEDLYKYYEIDGEIKKYKAKFTHADYTPWLFKKHLQGTPELGGSPPPPNPLGSCTFGLPLLEWTNDKEVRQLLHIPKEVQAWEMCSTSVGYHMQPEASQFIYERLDGKYRTLFYSGDTDGAVPTHGSQQWMAELGWKTSEERRQYYVDGQVAGFVSELDRNFTFGTVHGCGHMAPQWKRPQTYHLIFNWLKQRPI